MEEAILNFNKQFSFKPEIINKEKINSPKHYILAGMGGSHLASGILKTLKPGIDLYVHRNYGLPPYDDEFLKESLLIASSHSGNTEEIVDFLEEGYSKGYNMAVMTTGGKLLEFAKENNLPYIIMPNDGIQPRAALGYSIMSMATMIGEKGLVEKLRQLENNLDPASIESRGKEIADLSEGKMPIIYSSSQNLWVAYNWKIKMNETGKVPASYNVFPELNHNELNGFFKTKSTEHFSSKYHVIILRDIDSDHPRIQKRMAVTGDILEESGIYVTTLGFEGDTPEEKIFNSLLLADWIAVHIARNHNTDPEQVPMIEGFKKKLTSDYPDDFSDYCVWC